MICGSRLFGPLFLGGNPQLSDRPSPLFAPSLIRRAHALLKMMLINGLRKARPGYCNMRNVPHIIIPTGATICGVAHSRICHFRLGPRNTSRFDCCDRLLQSKKLFTTRLTRRILTRLVSDGLFDNTSRGTLVILNGRLD